MKFEINVTLETKTQDKFDDILTQVGPVFKKQRSNLC